MPSTNLLNLQSTYLRLGTDSAIETLPVANDFWPKLIAGELGSFHNEYLVTCYTYDKDWPSWERHPNGDEIVCLLSGAVTVILEGNDDNTLIELRRMGDYAFIPKGTWHTAKTTQATTMLFITAGEGTENRAAQT
jgi:uncharacterized cupin superfamily protein